MRNYREATRARRPRVVVASRIFAPEAAAASFRLWALTCGLSVDAQVTVRTVRPARTRAGVDPVPNLDVPESVRLSRWPVLRDESGVVRGYVQYLSFDVPLVLRLLFGRRPDVIVSEPPPTTGAVVRLVSALRRVPYVYYAADVWSDAARSTDAPRALVRGVVGLERWALRGASSVIAVSTGVAERLRELGVEEQRIVVVPNGVDTEVFSPDGPVHTEPDGRPYLIYAGTASEWQGAEIFIQALVEARQAAPDTRLVFLGQGSAWPAMRKVAAELGLSVGPRGDVSFVEAVPPTVAAQWLRGASCALVSLVPGLGYDFAFPTKVFAAVACGTPVLYVGPGPAGAVIRDNDLGTACDYELAAVAEAMADRLTSDAPSVDERGRLAAWVQGNASAAQTGRSAADVVRRAGRRQAAGSSNPGQTEVDTPGAHRKPEGPLA